MANIKKYKKKDGSNAYMFNAYLGVDPLTGKSKRTTRRGFKTQKEAKLALAQLQLEVENGIAQKQNLNTFNEVYELWLTSYKLTVKLSSYQRVKILFKNQILPIFGDLRIKKISTAFCQKVINDWSEEGAPTRLRSYTKQVFQYAISMDIIDSNPMLNLIIPRRKQRDSKKKNLFLERDQLNSFLKLAKQNEDQETFTMFHVLAYTGLRKGELYALHWEDLDAVSNTLSVSKTAYYLDGQAYISTTKTNTSTRTISIDPSTIKLLLKWRLEQKKRFLSQGIPIKSDDSQLIFSNTKNELFHNQFLNGMLNKYPQFNITPHGFRHTHASLLFEAQASIKQVQKRLGHKNVNTTLEIYTHVTKEAEKETADLFLNYMNSQV